MKLKKIASLMLAGVMAISMLAGCASGNSSSNNGASSNAGTSVSDISAAIENAVKKNNSDLKITYKSGTNMIAALNDLFKDTSYNDLTKSSNQAIVDVVGSYLSGATNKGLTDLTTTLNSSTKADTNDVVTVTVMTGLDKVSDTTAQVWAANTFAQSISGLKNTFTGNASKEYEAEYNLYAFYGEA